MTCNAELHIADDYGDNHATMKCQLEVGHAGPHRENFQHGGTPVTLTWETDEREALRLEGMDLKRFQFMLEHIADGWFPFTLAAHSMTNWRTPDEVRAIIDAEISRRHEPLIK